MVNHENLPPIARCTDLYSIVECLYRYHNARKKKWVHRQTNENGLSRWVRDQHIEWKLINVLHMRVYICINFFFLISTIFTMRFSIAQFILLVSKFITFFFLFCVTLSMASWVLGHRVWRIIASKRKMNFSIWILNRIDD